MTDFQRVFRGYQREGDSLVSEIHLHEWNDDDEAWFRHNFRLGGSDPGFDCYPIDLQSFAWLQARFSELQRLQFEEAEYFLEADAVKG